MLQESCLHLVTWLNVRGNCLSTTGWHSGSASHGPWGAPPTVLRSASHGAQGAPPTSLKERFPPCSGSASYHAQGVTRWRLHSWRMALQGATLWCSSKLPDGAHTMGSDSACMTGLY